MSTILFDWIFHWQMNAFFLFVLCTTLITHLVMECEIKVFSCIYLILKFLTISFKSWAGNFFFFWQVKTIRTCPRRRAGWYFSDCRALLTSVNIFVIKHHPPVSITEVLFIGFQLIGNRFTPFESQNHVNFILDCREVSFLLW